MKEYLERIKNEHAQNKENFERMIREARSLGVKTMLTKGMPQNIYPYMQKWTSWNYLIVLAILAGTIQFIDGFIGIYQHDLMKSAGPFFLAIIQYIAVWWYIKKKI